MIVCLKCGSHNNDSEQFCASCGDFLEWNGEKVASPAPESFADDTPVMAEPPRRTLLQRIKASIGMGDRNLG